METLWSLLLFALIGLAAGWIAGQLIKGGGFGLVGNLIVGVVGALLGGLVFRLLGITTTNIVGELVAAVVGACLLLFLLRFVKK